MRNDRKDEKSKIETDDVTNRVVFGSPTIGGFIVFIIIIAFILYNIFSN